MGMTIDEAIKQLEAYTIPCGKYKVAYDLAVETMRKYQKIEQIVADRKGKLVLDTLVAIIKVVEDGNDD